MGRSITLAVAALAVVALGTVNAKEGGDLPFVEDVDGGLADAQRLGRPAVLYFTANW